MYSDGVATEAECVINTLVPYVLHFPPETENYIEWMFDEEVIDRCEHLKFDPTQNQVIDTQGGMDDINIEIDDNLEGFEFKKGNNEEGSDSSFSSNDEEAKVTATNNKKTTKRARPEDDDLISTFGGRSKSSTLVSPPRQKQLKRGFKFDEASAVSGILSSTMESVKLLKDETNQKFESLQKEKAEIRAQNNALHSQTSKLCQLLEGQQALHSEQLEKASSPLVEVKETREKRKASSGNELQ